MTEALITGMGVISSGGLSLENYWNTLDRGSNTFRIIDRFPEKTLTVHVCSPIDDQAFVERFGGGPLSFADRTPRYARAAVDQALANARLDASTLNSLRVGLVMGSSVGCIAANAVNYLIARSGKDTYPEGWTPSSFRDVDNHTVLHELGNAIGAGPMRLFVSNGCSTGTDAVGIGSQLVKWNLVDLCVVVGVEAPIDIITLSAFNLIGALNKTSEPLGASKPFDKTRSGFVLGEGAGALVIENADLAKRRNITVQACVKGYATTTDAVHRTAPAPDGANALRAVDLAIRRAGISRSKIDCVLAHATSTPVGDVVETRLIKRAFGAHSKQITVTAIKSAVGHSSGASGALQTIAGVLMIQHSRALPTHNLITPDPECDLNYLPEGSKAMNIDNVMSMSFGFSGKNSIVVLGK